MGFRSNTVRLLFGVGHYDLVDLPVVSGGVVDFTYNLWGSMLCHCYSEKFLVKLMFVW